MESKVIAYSNAVLVLYRAVLNGEVTQEEFFKIKSILKRCKIYCVDIDSLKEEDK